MNNDRIKKLERISRELVTNYIFQEIEDSELTFGLITVTGVKVSSDLSYLDIYVSALKNGETLAKTLAKHNYEIQSRLHKSLAIRKLPRIRYRYDNSGAKGQEINDLMNKVL